MRIDPSRIESRIRDIRQGRSSALSSAIALRDFAPGTGVTRRSAAPLASASFSALPDITG